MTKPLPPLPRTTQHDHGVDEEVHRYHDGTADSSTDGLKQRVYDRRGQIRHVPRSVEDKVYAEPEKEAYDRSSLEAVQHRR